MEIFNLRNLSELEIRKAYQLEISNRSAAMENLNTGNKEDVNKTWENIKQNYFIFIVPCIIIFY